MCFDSQMKVWDTTENSIWNNDVTKIFKNINGNKYGIVFNGNPVNGKARYEADAWARCMKK
tara:strand:- start:4327 stop:4509 length:183 start_codon:yes stop_codon:yes gene_type:complete